MSWKMTCPKCFSNNLELERDRRVAGIRGPHQVQLHCITCGFVLYGEKAVQEECDRQYTAFLRERNLSPEDVEPTRRSEPEAAPAARSESSAASGSKNAAASSAAKHDNGTGTNEAPAEGLEMCAWDGCGKVARPRSKYCSRNCSNKNARARHAKRKKV